MATVHLHPTACSAKHLQAVQRTTGLIATDRGELITHDEHQRRLNSGAMLPWDRPISARVRAAMKRNERRQAERRCRFPDPKAHRSHRQDMVEFLRDPHDHGPGAA